MDTSGPQSGRSVTAEIDLDALAQAYDHRPGTALSLTRAHNSAVVAGVEPGDLCVDIGGGRGDHAATWLDLEARPVVVDPAPAMMRAARRNGLVAVVARGEDLPLRSGLARLAYFHLSIHYCDWRRALDEALRVLIPGGQVSVWTLGPDHHRTSLLARWFPRVADIDGDRFPDPSLLVSYLADRCATVVRQRVIEPRDRPVREWVRAVEARFVSTLQLLEDDEIREGLARFELEHSDPEAMVRYELRYDWVRATV